MEQIETNSFYTNGALRCRVTRGLEVLSDITVTNGYMVVQYDHLRQTRFLLDADLNYTVVPAVSFFGTDDKKFRSLEIIGVRESKNEVVMSFSFFCTSEFECMLTAVLAGNDLEKTFHKYCKK